MIRIFSVLATANALGLLMSFAFGLMSMLRGGLDNKNDLIFNVHFLCGLFSGVVTLLVHCMIFTYFLGTGRWVKEVTLAYDLPDAPLHKTTRELKRKAFPPALFAMLAVMAAAFAGGGRMMQGWPYQFHLVLAVVAILVNFWAYWVEVRSLRANDRVLAGVYEAVDRVRAARGLPSNADALRMEQEQQA